jgi:hypothetical protein
MEKNSQAKIKIKSKNNCKKKKKKMVDLSRRTNPAELGCERVKMLTALLQPSMCVVFVCYWYIISWRWEGWGRERRWVENPFG